MKRELAEAWEAYGAQMNPETEARAFALKRDVDEFADRIREQEFLLDEEAQMFRSDRRAA